ncbi:MAG TPA: di-heme oxidoredictase family protein [Terriglobales bacterium]|nr:di-heme oxidoredictase family protein [Terriglobales bacterium]
MARLFSLTVCLLGAAGGLAIDQDRLEDAALSAGTFTINRADREAYSKPAPVLDYRQRERFLRGRHHFNQKWVVFPSLGGDWGLGPTFIADRCSGCHVGGGRGDTPKSADQQLFSVLVRISIPGEDPDRIPVVADLELAAIELLGYHRTSHWPSRRLKVL